MYRSFTVKSCFGHRRNGVWVSVGSRVTKVSGGKVRVGVNVGGGVVAVVSGVSVSVTFVGGVAVGVGVASDVGVAVGAAVGGRVTAPGAPGALGAAGVRTGPGPDGVGVPAGAASSGVQA